MSKVVSIINLKGGVGKTTITVALAEFLVIEKQIKVLVIDLDPQTNSTVSLIGVRRWRRKEKIMNHVIESVSKQMAKGEASLK